MVHLQLVILMSNRFVIILKTREKITEQKHMSKNLLNYLNYIILRSRINTYLKLNILVDVFMILSPLRGFMLHTIPRGLTPTATCSHRIAV